MVGWYHQFNGHEFEQVLGVGDGQGSLACHSLWGLFQNFPQFIVIHTVKGFGIVNKSEVDVFLELSCFIDVPTDVDNLISGSSAFSKTGLNI